MSNEEENIQNAYEEVLRVFKEKRMNYQYEILLIK